jgi:hypothetical protein
VPNALLGRTLNLFMRIAAQTVSHASLEVSRTWALKDVQNALLARTQRNQQVHTWKVACPANLELSPQPAGLLPKIAPHAPLEHTQMHHTETAA